MIARRLKGSFSSELGTRRRSIYTVKPSVNMVTNKKSSISNTNDDNTINCNEKVNLYLFLSIYSYCNESTCYESFIIKRITFSTVKHRMWTVIQISLAYISNFSQLLH